MTFAPVTLRELAAYWTQQGGVDLGIVGDSRHVVGYHCGRDRIYSDAGQGDSDYSVQQPRDKAGLTNAAAGFDIGKLGGTYTGLQRFSVWLVRQCQQGEKGSGDVREIIFSADGSSVQRWSGVDGKIHTGPGNGDSSHRFHTHISYFRDSEDRDKVALFAPYFEEDDMGLEGGPVEPGKGIGEVKIKTGRHLVNLRTGKTVDPAQDTRTSFGRWRLAEPYGGDGIGRQSGYLVSLGAEGHIALDDVVESFTPAEGTEGEGPLAPLTLAGDGVEYRRV